jgi:hypothetical protein
VDYAVELLEQNPAVGEVTDIAVSGDASIWQNWLGRTPF